ncbi:MAG TPA: hypothetical protein VIC08_07020 [Cellvibrionaceae bacterium]
MSAKHQQAIKLARQDDWHGAHNLIQDDGDSLACQIHGYLHRVEGDLGNAAYWYRRAGIAMPDNSIEQELARLAEIA